MGSLLKSSANSCLATRSLHLDIQICECGDYNEWNKAIRNLATHLPNIQHLYINLDLDFNDGLLRIHSAMKPTTWRSAGKLYQLDVLPLDEGVLVVADEDWAHGDRHEGWWDPFPSLSIWMVLGTSGR